MDSQSSDNIFSCALQILDRYNFCSCTWLDERRKLRFIYYFPYLFLLGPSTYGFFNLACSLFPSVYSEPFPLYWSIPFSLHETSLALSSPKNPHLSLFSLATALSLSLPILTQVFKGMASAHFHFLTFHALSHPLDFWLVPTLSTETPC